MRYEEKLINPEDGFRRHRRGLQDLERFGTRYIKPYGNQRVTANVLGVN